MPLPHRTGAYIASATIATALLIAASGVHAQAYPTKVVRIVVGTPPGGSLDFVARHVAQKLTGSLGRQVIIDNRPGAGGNIGTEVAAKGPADGYTLLVTSSFYTINPSLYRVVNYDPIKDFDAVSLLTAYMLFLVAHPSLPVRSVKDLLALAKSRPGQVNYASTGTGTTTHVAGELLASMAGAKMQHIPYKGTNPMLPAILGGEVALAFGTTSIVPLVQAKKLVLIGVTGAKRFPIFPEVPTIAEGGLPGYDVTSWNAMLAPAGTPQPIIKRLNDEIAKAMSQPDTMETFDRQGLQPAAGSPEALATMIKAEYARWAKVIKDADIPKQ